MVNRRSFFSLVLKAAVAIAIAPAKFLAPEAPHPLEIPWDEIDKTIMKYYFPIMMKSLEPRQRPYLWIENENAQD